MRSAAWILIATAVLGVLGWLVTSSPPPLTSAIDLFLGIQLLRLRHNWRAWAMLRAWVGLAIAAFICFSATAAPGLAAAAIVALAVGQGSYAGSLLLLLFGVPSMRRVIIGRVVFGRGR